MRCFLAPALTAFFSFAWSDAEAATVTGTFNVQVTIAPTRKISRAFGVLLLPAWFAASGASAASLQVAPVLLEVVAPGAAATITLRNNGAKPIATQVRVFRWIQEEPKQAASLVCHLCWAAPAPGRTYRGSRATRHEALNISAAPVP